ncbi:MAG: YhfC family intramembrane metalloprotease [Oscillospiraceae bacterium]|nr:YhfC family intramembrane metalloprotease [Oscillospiraceae bacterium]
MSALISAGTFVVFAIVLEQLLHTVMTPLVKDSPLWTCVYGALAAGIFEETGRFLVTRFLMKNRPSTENAVLMGLGHGGAEAIMLLGFTMFAYAGIAVYANEAVLNAAVLKLTERAPSQIKAVLDQLNAIKDYNVLNAFTSLYERFMAMIFHVCMSVWAYKAVTYKMRLFPAAIAVHALQDVPAAMYQVKIINSILVVYVIMTVFVMAVVFVTIKLVKKFPDNAR